MPEFHNPVRERLLSDELILGLNLRHPQSSVIAPLLKDCGYHWLFLDDETTPLSGEAAYELSVTAIGLGIAPFVRVRTNDPGEISVHLCNGALGVFVPHVDTAEQAEQAARSGRFPPRGIRSVPGSFPQLGFAKVPFVEAARTIDEETMVVAMIESPKGIDNVDAIAAVEGIDVLFVGLHDLTYAMGLPGGDGDERVVGAVERVCRAAKAHGKFVGMGGVEHDELWEHYVRMGMRLLLAGNDMGLLAARARERADFFLDMARL